MLRHMVFFAGLVQAACGASVPSADVGPSDRADEEIRDVPDGTLPDQPDDLWDADASVEVDGDDRPPDDDSGSAADDRGDGADVDAVGDEPDGEVDGEPRDVPCPPGDLCGPGEFIDPASGSCIPSCRAPCANPCPEGEVCGCSDIAPGCGSPFDCPCWTDYQCRVILDPGGDLCDGTWYCHYPICLETPPVSCPPGTTCDPATGECRPGE